MSSNKKMAATDASGGTIRSLNFDELWDENFELLADIADFLGMEDLYRDPGEDDYFVG